MQEEMLQKIYQAVLGMQATMINVRQDIISLGGEIDALRKEMKELKDKQDKMEIRLQTVESNVQEMRQEQADTADILRRVVKQVEVLSMAGTVK